MSVWVESRDHKVNARFRGVVVIGLAVFYVVRLWGRPADPIDLFFGVLVLALAGVAAMYGVSHVSLLDDGVQVWNGVRNRRLTPGEVADTTVATLGTRRRPASERPDWRDAAAPSYLAFVLQDGSHVIAYGVAHEPSLRRRSAGTASFVTTIDQVRAHLGLDPVAP